MQSKSLVRAPKMQNWSASTAHQKYIAGALSQTTWCCLAYVFFGALSMHFYIDEHILDKETVRISTYVYCFSYTGKSVNKAANMKGRY